MTQPTQLITFKTMWRILREARAHPKKAAAAALRAVKEEDEFLDKLLCAMNWEQTWEQTWEQP